MQKNDIQSLIAYCIELEKLLKEDAAILLRNNVQEIESSNIKKEQVLNKMTPLIENIEKSKVSNSSEVDKVQQLIMNSNELIAINNQVISSNLDRIKSICDDIIKCSITKVNIYNVKGETI